MKTIKFFFIIMAVSIFTVCAFAQELNIDRNIMKRTPQIDGKITPGEWDIFYRYPTEKETVTAYADWDYENFYLGVSANSVTGLAIMFDMDSDGWTVGDENFLLLADNGGALEVYKAVNVGENKISLVSYAFPQGYEIVYKQSEENNMVNIEMCFNANIFGITSFDKEKGNFNFSVRTKDTDWTTFNPSELKDSTLSCALVNHKAFSLSPLDMELYVTRERAVAGATLDGKVKIKNRSKEPVFVKELIIAGEGMAEDIISSSKIIVGEIKPGKTFEREYHSKILPDTPIGCKVLGCEIYADNMKIGGAIRTFEIITPARFIPFIPKNICYTSDKTVRCGVRAISYSDTKHSQGYASITVPEGWEIEGNNKNKFDITGYNKFVDLVFRLTPPLGTVGHVRLPVTVTLKDSEPETIYCDFDIVQSK